MIRTRLLLYYFIICFIEFTRTINPKWHVLTNSQCHKPTRDGRTHIHGSKSQKHKFLKRNQINTELSYAFFSGLLLYPYAHKFWFFIQESFSWQAAVANSFKLRDFLVSTLLCHPFKKERNSSSTLLLFFGNLSLD